MNLAEQFNSLNGIVVTRKDLEKLLERAEKEKHTIISKRIIKVLHAFADDTFLIELKNLVEPYGLNGIEAAMLAGTIPHIQEDLDDDEIQGLGKAVSSTEIYDYITNVILNTIKEVGHLPWQKEWIGSGSGNEAKNYVSKKPYNGINYVMLNFDVVPDPNNEGLDLLVPIEFDQPYYLTFNQIKEAKGKLKKGSTARRVFYYTNIFSYKDDKLDIKTSDDKKWKDFIKDNALTKDDLNKHSNRFPMIKYYNVFRADDVEGLFFPEKKPTKQANPIEAAQAIIDGYKDAPFFTYQGDRAYYSPSIDKINMPKIEAFSSEAFYYSTFFHEMIHSTGHEKRLNRDFKASTKKGDKDYAFEELVAELGAVMLCGEAGILFSTKENSAKYLKGWNSVLITELENDNRFFLKASAQAQKAVNHILGREVSSENTETTKTENKEVLPLKNGSIHRIFAVKRNGDKTEEFDWIDSAQEAEILFHKLREDLNNEIIDWEIRTYKDGKVITVKTVLMESFPTGNDSREAKTIEKNYTFSKEDIPYEVAYRAYTGISFSPEKRAKSEQEGYYNFMKEVYDEYYEMAVKQDKLALFQDNFEKFKEGYLRRSLDYLRSRHGIYSTMIAGGSKFPVARMEKLNKYADNKRNELIEFSDKGQKRLLSSLTPEEDKPIKTGQSGALEILKKKLKEAEEIHARGLAGNKLFKKIKANPDATKQDLIDGLLAIGFNEEEAKKEASYFLRYSYAKFHTTNSNAKVNRIKEQIALEEKLNQAKETKGNKEVTFEGGTIIDNLEVNKIQILFNSKPSEEIRTFLKKGGQAFKWSPTNGVWQRQLNTYERYNRKDLYTFLGVNNEPTPPAPKEPKESEKKKVTDNSVEKIDINSIWTDENRFQNRNKLNQQVIEQIVENYNPVKMDPVVVWFDKTAHKIFVLAGHHRFEALKRMQKETVSVVFYEATEAEAIKYAKVESNANRSLETPQERANIYRAMRENGATKLELLNEAKKLEGKNTNYILNLSFLNPKGIVIDTLDKLSETSDKQNATLIERIADWIGEAKRRSDLTDAHEREMFDFLQDKEASKRIKTKADFLHKIVSIIGFDFDRSEPLNLKRFKYESEGEKVYNDEYKELQNKLDNLLEKRIEYKDRLSNPKNANYINPNSKDYDTVWNNFDNAMQKINDEVKVLQAKIIELSRNKGNYTNAGTNQIGLFGKVADKKNKNSLAYKMANRSNVKANYFKIADKDLSSFLGEIEIKDSESIVISLTGGQGSMKTRFAFQCINALAQNYKVGHASIEEHPDSVLYFDKVKQYLNGKALQNVEAPEIKSSQDLDRLIKANDVIIIDSFAKMQEIERGFEVDKDLRKKYNGKLFLVIFQQTTDGKMRGGSKSQFDADIVLFTKKEEDYRNNYVYADKNRYQSKPLDGLHFNIFNKKLNGSQDEPTKKIKLSFNVN
jgi:antirestriction protein ArdC